MPSCTASSGAGTGRASAKNNLRLQTANIETCKRYGGPGTERSCSTPVRGARGQDADGAALPLTLTQGAVKESASPAPPSCRIHSRFCVRHRATRRLLGQLALSVVFLHLCIPL